MQFTLAGPMFKFSVGLLLVLFAASTAWAAQSVQAQLLKLEQVWLQAAQQRDIPVLDRILSNDYVDINYQGLEHDKAEALRAPNIRVNRYTQKLSQEKVRVYGKTAVVTGRGTLMKGSRHYAWRFTDVFVSRHGRWRAVASQETPVRHR